MMQPEDLVGKQLDEYRLEALLGQGGMAQVYRAVDVRLQRYVAIKVIDAPFRADSDHVMRFEREAQAIAKMEHPHIVRLYRYGEVEGLLYMAMQYVQGASLRLVLDSYQEDNDTIKPEEVIPLVRNIGLALDYAHSQGVIHRDIKPSNIMLDRQGQALLADFGLALMTEVGTRGEVFGSPHYIAPEQAISSAGAVPQSDLYSLGVILYEMFSGVVPFDAEAPLDIAHLHLTEPPPPPSQHNPDVSPALEAVILKSLSKEPGGRFATGSELAQALKQALKPEPTEHHRPAEATVLHRPIPERVDAELAQHPLPPIPAASALPTITSDRAQEWLQSASSSLIETPDSQRQQNRFSCLGWMVVAAGMVAALIVGGLLFFTQQGPTGSQDTTSVATPESILPAMSEQTPIATEHPNGPTVEPGIEPTASDVPPTNTLASTETPTVQQTMEYELLIAWHKDDSLFVVNTSAAAFPLGLLVLSNRDGEISGEEWGVVNLLSGQCVAVWKDVGKPKSPKDVECEEVGRHLTRSGKQKFWKTSFDVYYDGQQVGVCEKSMCQITITATP